MKAPWSLMLLVLPACATHAVPASPAAAAAPPAAPASPSAPVSAPPPAPPLSPGMVSIGEIAASPKFDPQPTVATVKADLLRCYNETRTLIPDLHGKLMLRVRVNDDGKVTATDAQPGGQANDPGLIACIADAMQTVTFPRPGGNAVITVPLVFRR